MTAQSKIKAEKKVEAPTGLDLLREPFPANQISKLPKPTKRQTDEVRADFKKGIRCKECGQWHHPQVVHLDYVGHAALTDRLLDCDPNWNWEPMAFSEAGTPLMDDNGGMWIKLTVCNQTRLGYGHPDGKRGGDAIKEVIGDALRNAAMRFGAALDLWHKGDLHAAEDEPEKEDPKSEHNGPSKDDIETATTSLSNADTLDRLRAIWSELPKPVQHVPAVIEAKDKRKAALERPQESVGEMIGDEIPY
ncbi:hypothetical protein [Roseovarius indicus]|uniref:Uncharacterized protein n=1 Tax=Roseovarius indicus TaxID=540747 RepID=A0A5P3ABL3_9RHOB|nr:hypothetical protein [Roseovarius indicus]QEW26702.1 hypothetical protein RIdsm_02504 [Roseovarius indicus]SFD61402.1 hypothetical protein SAMN04488031_101838 [Roseovarius indicus]